MLLLDQNYLPTYGQNSHNGQITARSEHGVLTQSKVKGNGVEHEMGVEPYCVPRGRHDENFMRYEGRKTTIT